MVKRDMYGDVRDLHTHLIVNTIWTTTDISSLDI
jgi:hypothetical protein